HFGWSVSVSVDTVAVGAPDFDGISGAVTNSGSVYVFTRSAGFWTQQFAGVTNVQDSRLGWAVAISGNTIAAGAPLRSATLLNQGIVRIYTRNGTTWTQQPDVVAPDAAAFDQLGTSVAIGEDENTVVSGAHMADAPNANQGAAYVFKRANIAGSLWTMEAKLRDVNGQANDNFGEAVGISGETVIVGAYLDNEPGVTDWGSAFVFERRGTLWSFVKQLGAFTAQAGTFFGGSVGISGGQMVIGAPGFDDGTQTDQGMAFIAGGLGCLSLTVSPATLPGGFVGSSYSQSFSATGDGEPSHDFVVSAGSLPVGLTLSGSTLSGTPSATGTYNFTVTATAPNLCSANRNYTVPVQGNCPPFIINPTLQNFTAAGGTGTISVTANDGCRWTASSNANWITLSDFGGVGSGTVGFTVAANVGGERSGTITIPGQNFLVIQAAAVVGGLQFYPLPFPVRLLDTRVGATGCDAPGAMIPGGTSRTQTAAGRTCGGVTIPANAAALAGNVTTVLSGGGFLTLYPSDIARPITVNSNYAPNQTLNNVFTVRLGVDDGAFKIFVSTDTDLVVDVTGYYAPPSPSGLYFHPLPRPVRLLDTRAGASACFTPGMALQAGSTTTQIGTTTCDGVLIPAGAQALVGNATTVSPLQNGYLTLFPADAARPLAASSNFQAGVNLNAPFMVGLSPSGQFNIFTLVTTDLVIDVTGYFSTQLNDANGQGVLFSALFVPVRLLDTRAGQPACLTPGAPAAGGATVSQIATGACTGLPATAQAIAGNVTTLNAVANGYLTFWPSNANQPLIATSNYRSGVIFNRHFTVALGPDGAFKRFALTTTDLVIDLTGYFAP
ncbi:MAG: putative Ig domain-containing protein, partial [Blastocatellia bacterium]